MPKPDTLTPDNAVGDILAVADAVGAGRFAYYGYSWLALCGLQLAIRTDRLTALVMGGFPPIDGPYQERLRVTAATHAMAQDARPAPEMQDPPRATRPADEFDWSKVKMTMSEPQTRQFTTLYREIEGSTTKRPKRSSPVLGCASPVPTMRSTTANAGATFGSALPGRC